MVVATAGLVVDLAIAVTTCLPGAPMVPTWPELALFPVAFLVQFTTIVRLGSQRRQQPVRLMDDLPLPALVGFGALVTAAALVLITSRSSLGGNPVASHGRYYLNDHGYFTQVTKAQYEHAVALSQRLFAIVPSVFFAINVLLNRPPTSEARQLAVDTTAGSQPGA